MEPQPVNRLLQLLRQKPSDTAASSLPPHPTPAPSAVLTPSTESDTQPTTPSDIHPITSSDIQPATKSDTQPVPFDNTQPDIGDIQTATSNGTQPATKSDTQPAKNNIVYATKSDTHYVAENHTLSVAENHTPYATKSDTLAFVGLSKGQQRVLAFLTAHGDPQEPSRTTPVGYDAISRHCFLSRSGTRKVVDELEKKGIIQRIETKRGETQGSVYSLQSNIQYITKSDIPSVPKNDIHPATSPSLCSSSKEQLLQGLVFEHAFHDLQPRSLVPYLEQFASTAELQDFLDMANACIAAARDGRSKPIQNPQGFLFAQLRAGYVNPPDGYKSRRMLAQEERNRLLEAELTALQSLKEREHELRLALFAARLTAEDQARLEQEARAHVKPGLGLSEQFQLNIHKETVLKQWFAQQEAEQR